MTVIKKKIKFGDEYIYVETGFIAKQSTSSVVVEMNGTKLLVTVVSLVNVDNKNYLPLRVDYQERFYACGKIPGSFFKREGRPTEREVLISRLIDRPLRPLFYDFNKFEIQIIVTVFSINPEVDPDILSIIGVSCALSISNVFFKEPIAAVRVGYNSEGFFINTKVNELNESKLNLVVAGTNESILMVESSAKELTDDIMVKSIFFGHKKIKSIIEFINDFSFSVKKNDCLYEQKKVNECLYDWLYNKYNSQIIDIYNIQDKLVKKSLLNKLYEKINLELVIEMDKESYKFEKDIVISDIIFIIEKVERNVVRNHIINTGKRLDNRDFNEIRFIEVYLNYLSRAHGSAVFIRGETQVIVSVTLGTKRDAQIIDTPFLRQKDEFIFHYNFNSYCVGEIGIIGSPKRREIGHGNLAKRAIQAVFTENDFPYVIRVVSEVTESNGSSSMASICGASLALMDAGVNIKNHIAGIAMGLIKESDKYVILSDISGEEDHYGDMDFKVAGTKIGITALQMDVKVSCINENIMSNAFKQAVEGYNYILSIMDKFIHESKKEVSKFAPKIKDFKISVNKIKDVIGKGGSIIKSLIGGTDVSVDIQDNGNVQMVYCNTEDGERIYKEIKRLSMDLEIGKMYKGKVVRITEFGAFINLVPGKDGLVHISQIVNYKLNNVRDILSEGQEVDVKLIDIDKQGKIRLSMKNV
ncbi:MAG: polyribonucleotide nucleotidyltransferase [Candidatus Azosocius agrarius]|nr:MAG: polyribonucleotide nucleotidyltransferase [Gammaproteobacteria bacterium]